MMQKNAKPISHECPTLAKIAPNNCRVETISVCLSDNPDNPKIEVTGCNGEKFCGFEFIPPPGSEYDYHNCYVAKNPRQFLHHFKD